MHQHIIRFSHPAENYISGLPVGNGRLAAMVCGGAERVRIALNHEWLWRGKNRYRDCDDVSFHLPEVREAILAGDFETATRLANEYFAGRGGISGLRNRVDPYQPAGDLMIDVPGGGSYTRTLDIDTGEVSITSGATWIRTFASFADGFIVVNVKGPGEAALSRITDPECDVTVDGLSLRGQFTCGISFEIRGREYICEEAGAADGSGASRTILLDICTSAGGGPLKPFPDKVSYADLFARHIEAFKEAKGTAELDVDFGEDGALSGGEANTDERLAAFRNGIDPALSLLYFEFGRYLLVSGSSGELPLNLQGKWNESLNPPWECDYHLDINLQMSYWAADPLGLTKQQDTLFALCDRYRPHGREMAKKLYGCDGVFFTLQTDLWGRMTPESKGWAVWIGAAPWMASHFTRRWKYTRDRDFLENRAYPFLKEVAAFYLDYLVEIDGTYHVLPSQSPENRFAESGGQYPVSIGIDAALDLELARETLETCIEMSEELGVDAALRERWRHVLSALQPLTTDSKGRLNEFDRERAEPEPGHRHLSHLYGLFPGWMFPSGHPLREACEKSLDYRLSHGGGHTGWSRSWTACLMAKLRRADDFQTHLTALISDFATESLLDLHPPRIFQIDGNLGGLAAICEMLLSCDNDHITLLGALPESWQSGSFRHFKAPGTLDVSCEWENKKAVSVTLTAEKGGTWYIRCGSGNRFVPVSLSDGETRTVDII